MSASEVSPVAEAGRERRTKALETVRTESGVMGKERSARATGRAVSSHHPTEHEKPAGEWDRRRAPSEGLRCVPDFTRRSIEHHASARLKIRARHHVGRDS